MLDTSYLVKGVAYHGNRMLSHVRNDMQELVRQGFNSVLHMFSHNDWDRHKKIMGEIFMISEEFGLDVWVDNWGLGGPPGDKSHFMSYHPDAHQCYNDGAIDPVHTCFNHSAFVQFTKDWLDVVRAAGGRKVFWDEPRLLGQNFKNGVPTRWSCRCANCKKLFEEQYNKPMPTEFTPEVEEFRKWTIAHYFKTVTAYAKSLGIYNSICIMLGAEHGIGLDSIAQLCGIETLDNIGSDPYWSGIEGVVGYQSVYDFVLNGARKNLEVCARFGKEHNLWIQSYFNPRGTEEEIVAAADALWDAGARSIWAWGYRGSEANDYRSELPDATWKATCDGFARITENDRNARRAIARERNEIK